MKIITFPDPVLRKKSMAVDKIDSQLKENLDQMLDIMYKSQGVGLSAVQVGILQRFFLVDIDPQKLKNSSLSQLCDASETVQYPLIVINPKIISRSKDVSCFDEGCLSIPTVSVNVKRHVSIELEFYDINMKQTNIICKDLLARVVQHEYDHLEGKLIIDYLSYVKKDMLVKKLLRNNISNI